jgi:acyl carrier protein
MEKLDVIKEKIMEIKEKLKKIIVDIVSTPVEINDNMVLTKDLGFDSVQIISLIVEIESQFDIVIEDEDLDIEKLTVVKNLIYMIENKLQRNQLLT